MSVTDGSENVRWRVGLTLGQVASVVGGRIVRGSPNEIVDVLIHDTRCEGRGAMYVAIIGENLDGHDYLAQAVATGCSGAMISNLSATESLSDKFFVLEVGDTVEALGRLAAEHRSRFDIPVVAVAGSGGKTTTKELIAHLLSSAYRTYKTPGNRNNLIGLPLALLELTAKHDAAVLEMGMNQPGELGRLTRICAPALGVLTNVGKAHVGMFGSEAGLVEAKSEFIAGLPASAKIFYNADCPRSGGIIKNHRAGRRAWSVGLSPDADYRIFAVERYEEGYRFAVQHGIESMDYFIPGFGKYNVHNGAFAVAVATELWLDVELIASGLKSFETTSMRSQLVDVCGAQFIVDCYNASPDGMAGAIASLAEWPAVGKKIAVLGDMFELGAEAEAIHAGTGALFGRFPVDHLVVMGEMMKKTAEAAELEGQEVTWAPSANEAIDGLASLVKAGDVVLFKGSRGMRMEVVVNGLKDRLTSMSGQE